MLHYQISLGVTSGLWYRSVSTEVRNLSQQEAWLCKYQAGTTCILSKFEVDATELSRQIVPFVIPTLSVKSASGKGIGANLAFIPKLEFRGFVVPVNTWVAQVTYTF